MNQPEMHGLTRNVSQGHSILNLLRLPAFESRQWWPAERLRRLQEIRLQKLVARAYEHVPFYRQLWQQQGIHPAEIRTIEDLARLPIVPASVFKQQPDHAITADDRDRANCITRLTSGSTGTPFAIVYDPADWFVAVKAASARFRLAHGTRLTDRIARFSPEPGALGRHSWYEFLGIWRTEVLSTAARPREWVQALQRFRPHVLAGMPHSIIALIDEMEAQGVTGIAPRLVTTSGMVLTQPDREFIRSRLKAQVVDAYGAFEAGFIAWECPVCPGYHINADHLIVEILTEGRPTRPGEVGDVVITNLCSSAMPVVRYKIGDLATPSSHQSLCGRHLPLIDSIMGRANDFISLPSGRRVELYKISSPVLRLTNVRDWLLVQEETGDCVLKAVPPESGKPLPQQDELLMTIRNSLDNEVNVRLELCEELPRDPSIKWKSIVSRYRLPGRSTSPSPAGQRT